MAAPAAPDKILDVNRRYHDVAARDYDAKWGISYGDVGQRQVLGKLTKLLGPRPGPFPRALEIGAGTGYFSLNLASAGVIGAATCTDISPGMLETLERNALALDLEVETVACDAAELPFEDESFDLVLGHAVLHHLPDLDRVFAELHRVLAPGGTLFFAGEPSWHGDRLAAVPKRAALRLAPTWRRAIRARPAPAHECGEDHSLEALVDVHAFAPGALSGTRAAQGSRASGCRARSCSPTGSAVQPHAGGERRPGGIRGAGSSTHSTATSGCSGRPPVARAAPSPAAPSTTSCSRRRRPLP